MRCKMALLPLLIIFRFLLVFTFNLETSESGVLKGQIPALYVFGDSLVDSGNNNYLNVLLRANFPPYGIDFEGSKPTGRFGNGKTIADYIAINYGLPLVPPYLGLSVEERSNISTGFNYASGGCGVFPEAGTEPGQCLALSNQTELFKMTVELHLPKVFKTKEELQKHLAESLFVTVIGVNDYNTLYNATETDPNAFADELLHRFLMELEKLHKLGARKFFVNNIKPLGCYPEKIVKTKPRGSCNELINRAISVYNTKLRKSLTSLRRKLFGTSFIYSDYFNFMLALRGPSRDHANSGLLDILNPCCPRGYNGTSFCLRRSTPCPSRDAHIFFDPFHPTQIANFMFAVRCFHETTICQVLKD